MLTGSDSKPQIIVAQLGARMHYAVPAVLHRAGMLAKFYTDAYVGRGSSWHILAQLALLIPEAWRPAAWLRLQGRREDSLPADKIRAFNRFGMAFALAHRKVSGFWELEKLEREYGRRFCELVLQYDVRQANGIYAFSSAALPLFPEAKKVGITNILEQIIAPKEILFRLLKEESELWDSWEPPYVGSQEEITAIEVEGQEWKAADGIICASSFVEAGLNSLGVPPDKIWLVPYAVEASRFYTPRQQWDGRRPLRILFVGGVMLRKGVQYLFKALEILDSHKISARMVGPVTIVEPYRSRLQERVELTGHRPRHEMLDHYAWADLFVLPSICEGSATVTYEALAAGLPVITTFNAGSVVQDGVEGFIVPIRDAAALAARIELLATNPGLLAHMAQKARERAAEYSWERYGERLAETLKEIMRL